MKLIIKTTFADCIYEYENGVILSLVCEYTLQFYRQLHRKKKSNVRFLKFFFLCIKVSYDKNTKFHIQAMRSFIDLFDKRDKQLVLSILRKQLKYILKTNSTLILFFQTV